jgi:hypothetical protein
LGVAVVLGALAVWRSQTQARARRRAQAVTGAVLLAALAVTTGAAVAQTRPTSPALAARRLAAASDPAQQVCQRRGPAVYCVFPGFEPQIGLWEPTVRAVLAGVPPAVAVRAVPVTVAQRVGWWRLAPDEDSLADAQDRSRGDRPVAPVGTIWGRDGQALAATQARLASKVAARVIGPPDRVLEPDGEQPKPSSGAAVEQAAPTPGCGARAVVALWLAARASPHVAEGLRQQVADSRFPSFVFVNDVDFDDVWWGEREGQFALALLDRPSDQVAQALWRHWDLVTSPATTLERLGELVGMQPPPRRAPALEVGGPLC